MLYAVIAGVLVITHATVFWLGAKHATSVATIAAAAAQVVTDAKKV